MTRRDTILVTGATGTSAGTWCPCSAHRCAGAALIRARHRRPADGVEVARGDLDAPSRWQTRGRWSGVSCSAVVLDRRGRAAVEALTVHARRVVLPLRVAGGDTGECVGTVERPG